nr:MAG TPA: hypothetical protein [Bacteriophage sp.]
MSPIKALIPAHTSPNTDLVTITLTLRRSSFILYYKEAIPWH